MKNTTLLLFLLLQFISKAQTFDITKFGAIGDGISLNTKAVQDAVDACSKNGGGTIVVPEGVFIIGTIYLKSNIHLYINNGAILRGSANLEDYTPYGDVHYGMLYAKNAENISIDGNGNIDGNGDGYFDLTRTKKLDVEVTKETRQKDDFRRVENDGLGDGPIAPNARPYQMLIFSNCKRITVKDVLITKAPFWTMLFADCDSVLIDGIRLYTNILAPNADGIDITSGRNITISNCDIRAGDDAIAIVGYASHFEVPGFQKLRHSSENINIYNCNLQSYSSGIRIGFLDQNSVRNINISNCNITNSTRGIGIYLRDEGSLENINISNVNIETSVRTGGWWGNGEPIHISAIRGNENVKLGKIKNVSFTNINCKSENGILLYGTNESVLENITFKNITFEFTDSKLNDVAGGNIDIRGCGSVKQKELFAHDIPGFYAQFVNGLTIQDFKLIWTNTRMPYFTNGIEINNFKDIHITNFEGTRSPINQEAVSIFLQNGEKINLAVNKKLVLKKINVKN